MRHARLALPIALLALALPASAGAKLPDSASHLIVLGKSIGGVTLFHTYASAKSAWGSTRGKCTVGKDFASCVYAASATKQLGQGNFAADKGKVSSVGLNGYTDSRGRPQAPTALKQYKTSKGIGLGSTAAAVKSAYRSAKKDGSGDFFNYLVAGPGKASTVFQINKGKVNGVFVRDGIHQG
jgi:hypothetical protein